MTSQDFHTTTAVTRILNGCWRNPGTKTQFNFLIDQYDHCTGTLILQPNRSTTTAALPVSFSLHEGKALLIIENQPYRFYIMGTYRKSLAILFDDGGMLWLIKEE